MDTQNDDRTGYGMGKWLSGCRNSAQQGCDYINSKILSHTMQHYWHFKENYILLLLQQCLQTSELFPMCCHFYYSRWNNHLYPGFPVCLIGVTFHVCFSHLKRYECFAFGKVTNNSKYTVSVKANYTGFEASTHKIQYSMITSYETLIALYYP